MTDLSDENEIKALESARKVFNADIDRTIALAMARISALAEEKKPGIVECEVYEGKLHTLTYNRGDTFTACGIQCAMRDPDFIGFKYEDGNIYPQPVMYSENCGLHFITQIESFASGKDIANRPTHVLFRSKK